MMTEAHNLIINFITTNIENIYISPRFIELLYQYQDTSIINKFSMIKTDFDSKLTPLNPGLKQINLDITAQLFLYLTKDVTIMDNLLYIYLLKTWISHYKDINESIIKYILNEHITKILSLDESFYTLYNYFKTSSYVESFNFFKIIIFDKMIELKNNKIEKYNDKYKELINKINKHNDDDRKLRYTGCGAINN
jgi:hypothetical protein